MKKIVNLITGIIAGIAPLVAAGVFGVLFYDELHDAVAIIVCVLLGILAIWTGIRIFKKIQRIGIFDFLTIVTASPDLDNLEPTADSNTKKRTPKELAELNRKNQSLFKGGTIKIFGDWHGEPYKNSLKILSIDYDEFKKQMEIKFAKNTRILIDEPDHILESPSVLKILSAKKIKLEFRHKKKDSTAEGIFFKTYLAIKNKIRTETNIDWTKQKMDAAIGQDALIIFD